MRQQNTRQRNGGRRLIGGATLAMAATIAAQPARAADGYAAPAPASPRSFSLQGLMAVTGVLPIAGIAAASVPADPDFRLHALADASPAQPRLPADASAARLRRGFGAAMMDYFPFGADGFHVSGGSRFYNRLANRTTTDTRYTELLYAPRSVLARAGRRMTPALTFGYTKIVQRGLSLGIEGGAMLGKFDTLAGTLARPPRLRGALGDGAGQLNQIARLTFGYRF